METEPGTKVHLLMSDDAWESGTFLCFFEEGGSTYFLLDQGKSRPTKINTGFVTKVLEEEPAEVIDLKKRRLLKAIK